jgi:hypothetical protein
MIIIGIQPVMSQYSITKKGTMNIGFETGIQFTGISDPYMPISDNGIGFTAGPYFEYYLSDIIKFRGGLYYDKRAFSLGDAGYIDDSNYYAKSSYYDVTQQYNVNYLTIPLSLIYIKGSNKFKFFIQGTFYYSMFLNSNQSGDFHIFISEEDASHYNFEGYPEFNIPGDHYLEIKEKDQFSTSDFGINLLFGAAYYIKPNLGITLSPGFSYSFANVWEDPLRKTTWTNIYKINIGITYTLNKK